MKRFFSALRSPYSVFFMGILSIGAVMLFSIAAQASNWVTPEELASRHVSASATTTQTAAPQKPYKGRHSITAKDLKNEVASALINQNLMEHADINIHTPNTGILYEYHRPLRLSLHALSVSSVSQSWQAQAYILSEGRTIAVIPVSGRYEALQRVPVLSRALSDDDIIGEKDIQFVNLPEQRLGKHTILTASGLIGLSPKNRISAGRPIRTHEIQKPKLVEKNGQVEMVYTSRFLTIRSIGKALEDGSKGDLIRIQNTDSGRAITARVVEDDKVEVNLAQALQ